MSSIGSSARVDSAAVTRREKLPPSFQSRYQGPSVEKPHQVATEVMGNTKSNSFSLQTSLTNRTLTIVGEADEAGEGFLEVGEKSGGTGEKSPIEENKAVKEERSSLDASSEVSHKDEEANVKETSRLMSGLKAAGSVVKSGFAATVGKIKEYAPTIIMLIGFTCLVGGLALSFTGIGMGPGLGIAALGALLIFGGSKMQKSRMASQEEKAETPPPEDKVSSDESSGVSMGSQSIKDKDRDETSSLIDLSESLTDESEVDPSKKKELESSDQSSKTKSVSTSHSNKKTESTIEEQDLKKEEEIEADTTAIVLSEEMESDLKEFLELKEQLSKRYSYSGETVYKDGFKTESHLRANPTEIKEELASAKKSWEELEASRKAATIKKEKEGLS